MTGSSQEMMNVSRKKKHKRRYTVRKDVEWLAPAWLAVRIAGQNIKLLYHLVDGAVQVKGVKVNPEVAEIGDVIVYDGKRLSVERG